MIVINYHVPIQTGLKDALDTAYDIYLSTGIKPDSIDYDGRAFSFHVVDARSVFMGSLSPKAYAERHEIKPVLSDSEDGD